jgi:DNA mismatch endonuclease, patch repair protein
MTSRFDPLTSEERSERMSHIRNSNTKPEMMVRRLVYGLGYRYRLHDKGLPGKPDLVFRSRYKVIFIHGCFWHQHGCRQYRMPKTRLDFWEPKLANNKAHDVRVQKNLRKLGWKCLIIWECQLRRPTILRTRIERFLEVI